MLRFAPWKLASVLALVAAAVLLVLPSFMSGRNGRTLWRPGCRASFPSPDRARPRPPGRRLHADAGRRRLGRSNPRSRRCATTSARRCATEKSRFRAASRRSRAASSSASPTRPSARRPSTLLQSLSQPIGGPLARRQRAQPRSHPDRRRRPAHADRRRRSADKVRHAVTQSIEVLNRRINAMGTKETVIQQQGVNRVLIEVPGLQDTTKLKEIIGQTAKLDFRLVADPAIRRTRSRRCRCRKAAGRSRCRSASWSTARIWSTRSRASTSRPASRT